MVVFKRAFHRHKAGGGQFRVLQLITPLNLASVVLGLTTKDATHPNRGREMVVHGKATTLFLRLRPSDFGFVSDFVVRISNFLVALSQNHARSFRTAAATASHSRPAPPPAGGGAGREL